MWDYSEKVREHFFNPRNSGPLENANGIGDFGSIKCGDALRLMLKVNPETEVIDDARFQTFGCGSAIASSSALTEIIKGKTLDEALQVSNQDIADYLDGLPPEKMHCSVMGREALQAAVANYRGETMEGRSRRRRSGLQVLRHRRRDDRGHHPRQQPQDPRRGGQLHQGRRRLFGLSREDRGHPDRRQRPPLRQSSRSPPRPGRRAEAPGKPKLTNYQRIRKIEETLEAIRPMLQRDHGDVTLVEVDGKKIYVELTGACRGCAMEAATLGGVQQKLIEALGELVQVLPVAALARA
jgi:NifU-like protein